MHIYIYTHYIYIYTLYIYIHYIYIMTYIYIIHMYTLQPHTPAVQSLGLNTRVLRELFLVREQRKQADVEPGGSRFKWASGWKRREVPFLHTRRYPFWKPKANTLGHYWGPNRHFDGPYPLHCAERCKFPGRMSWMPPWLLWADFAPSSECG